MVTPLGSNTSLTTLPLAPKNPTPLGYIPPIIAAPKVPIGKPKPPGPVIVPKAPLVPIVTPKNPIGQPKPVPQVLTMPPAMRLGNPTRQRLQNVILTITPMLSLDQLFNNLNCENVSLRIEAVKGLQNIIETEPESFRRILEALLATSTDLDCPPELRDCCISSFEVLIRFIPLEDVRSPLEDIRRTILKLMYLLRREEVEVENITNTITSLTETNANTLFPLLVKEIKDITHPEKEEDIPDDPMRCAKVLFTVIGRILSNSENELRNERLKLIADELRDILYDEKNRELIGENPVLTNSDFFNETLLALARRYAGDDFVDFLLEEVLEVDDPKDSTVITILPFCEAASEVLFQSPSAERVDELIKNLRENSKYNIIWIISKIVQQPNAIYKDSVPELLALLISIVNTSQTWQQADQAVKALGKMWPILDQNQQHQTLEILERALAGTNNIVHVSQVQSSAAEVLREIGYTTPICIHDILDFLIPRCAQGDYEVRFAIANALKQLIKINNMMPTPIIFNAFVGFLSDQDARIREVAAHALYFSISRHPDYAATQIQAIADAAYRALNIPPSINLQVWETTRNAVMEMLEQMVLIIPAARNIFQTIPTSPTAFSQMLEKP